MHVIAKPINFVDRSDFLQKAFYSGVNLFENHDHVTAAEISFAWVGPSVDVEDPWPLELNTPIRRR